jgi:sulfate transport system ATP-binding protein
MGKRATVPIQIQSLYKRFGTQPVLVGVDFDIADGELIALLGASGSGKTTLLRILAGLEWPDGGDLTVNGQSWLAKPAQERGLGFVPQQYALFDHMTVAANIAFGLTIRPSRSRPDAAAIKAVVARLLGLMQLEGLGERYPSQLSGGQRQRVALARALAIEPSVLLLDEPFGALDARVRSDLRRWLRSLHDKLGTTTVFVTHDQEEAFELADRVVLLNQGKIEQVGTPEEIFDRPRTPFVMRFLGGVNELRGQVSAGRVEIKGFDSSGLERLAIGDGEAIVFVRPDDIDVLPAETGEATLRSLDVLGTKARLVIDLDGHDKPIEAELRRDVIRSRGLRVGTKARLKALQARIFSSARASEDSTDGARQARAAGA